MKDIIWTPNIYDSMYGKLPIVCGTYASWDNKYSPGKYNKNFNDFCELFAIISGANSSRAVKNQINWAIGTPRTVLLSYKNLYLKNKMAAIRNGFMSYKYLTDKVHIFIDKNKRVLVYVDYLIETKEFKIREEHLTS